MADAPVIRPRRVAAIARLDLASELRGRGGWILPAVVTALLVPIAAAPAPRIADLAPPIPVRGDVPAVVAALPRVVQRDDAGTVFRQVDGRIEVAGPVRSEVRAALDGDRPAVRVVNVETPTRVPGRTLLLALISASGLTGAVASSIAGERTNRTLVALLTASVSPMEIVLGKWLAWGGLGTLGALAAAAGAVAGGRVESGWWMLAFPLVPLSLAAAGLWLVRTANDVVGGTATALRVLPTAVALLGIASWFVGRWSPELGATIPLGGALVAAGNTWHHALPNLIATASTGAFVAFALWVTARDLEETPPADAGEGSLAVHVALVAAIALGPTIGPLLWAPGGNPDLIDGLDPVAGRVGSAMGLGLLAAIALARRPVAPLRPAIPVLLGAAVAGLLVALVTGVLPTTALAPRLPQILPLGSAVLVAVGEELAFRTWLQRRAGTAVALGLWMLLRGFGDPIGTALLGLGATVASRKGGLGGAVLFRVAAAAGAGA